jgi:hypothetical protein
MTREEIIEKLKARLKRQLSIGVGQANSGLYFSAAAYLDEAALLASCIAELEAKNAPDEQPGSDDERPVYG